MDQHVIDCSAKPCDIQGSTVADARWQVPGRFTGKLIWDPKKVVLHLDPRQLMDSGQRIGVVCRDWLFESLAGKPVLPANVLDYLLEHPELIPEEWKKVRVFFWGSVYDSPPDWVYSNCIRHLSWFIDHWAWNEFCIDAHWGPTDLAAVWVG